MCNHNELAVSKDRTGETVAEDKHKDKGTAGPHRPNTVAKEQIVETMGEVQG
jgi:hypothetical protein